MSVKKRDILKLCLTNIKKHKLVFIEDVVAYLPFSRATFYNKGLDKIDAIKEALDKNKVVLKRGLRSKWYKGDNPTAQIALYKLISTEDEADRLNGTKQKLEHSGEVKTTPIGPIPVMITTPEQQALLEKHAKKDSDYNTDA